jgi:hypothetical protein
MIADHYSWLSHPLTYARVVVTQNFRRKPCRHPGNLEYAVLQNRCRRKGLLLMLQGYFDDSGSDGQRPPFVLAGYILPAEKWAAFSDAWNTELAQEPKIRYFKMFEAKEARGEFSSIRYEFRRAKILKLIEVMRKYQLHGVCANFKWDEWRTFSKTLISELKAQPYAPLFFLLIDVVKEYQKDLGLFPHKTQLDFDDQGKWGQFAIEWYGRMWAGVGPYGFSAEHKAMLEGTPRMLSDKEHVPLQAADMLAWAIRKRIDESAVPGNFDWVYDELHSDLWGGLGFSSDTWKAIKDQLPFRA